MVRRLKAHPTVFLVEEPTSWEARSTRMTSQCRGLFLPEAMWAFFKPLHTIVLPTEEGAAKEDENIKDIK